MAAPAHIARENGKLGGRPKGSTNVPRFSQYITDEERAEFAQFMKENYMGDMRVATWFGEHAFAKPAQEITGKDGRDLIPSALDQLTNEQLEEIIATRRGSVSGVGEEGVSA